MHFASPASTRSILSTRAIALALVVALWFAGTLGLMHRTLHVPGLAQAHAAAQAAHPEGAHEHAAHGIDDLFGSHSDAECRLYDQLSHGSGALGVPMMVLPVLPPSATFAYLEGEAIARWVALFDARGPPSTR
ncbi:hypothetical protein VAPA_1c38430 [Variovorax paradoxus B4]|uniref:DUF2946 domain-containing protein n=2 Tax=Variovorax paradoxus TaxID=34073 RepID=A0A0H2MF15_VARPD|nr:hypothetical protein [Variovorax paradoxus]AGU50925.1 hypothetical protein VAPA_1c38430 [Variovorax paradoxus B4]KLN55445.1 hypothetical protein VPARA_34690 [Variovorax paradoxus]